ncbi:MAG: hypothetical protein ABIR87_03310 [Sphingomicrobium sp.]
MSHRNAFEPIWPPSNTDDFEASPEFRAARRMYEAQKLKLGDLAGQGVAGMTAIEAHRLSQEIAVMLHNISGTAAHFGEAPLGLRASQLEQAVRTAFTPQSLHPRCEDILAALNPDRID